MKVYIASPYTMGDTATNIRNSLRAAELLRLAGHLPYVPLLTHFWHFCFPHEHAYWMGMSLEWVLECDAVVRLPGESEGADEEVTTAKEHGIPVYYDIFEFLELGRDSSLRSLYADLMEEK